MSDCSKKNTNCNLKRSCPSTQCSTGCWIPPFPTKKKRSVPPPPPPPPPTVCGTFIIEDLGSFVGIPDVMVSITNAGSAPGAIESIVVTAVGGAFAGTDSDWTFSSGNTIATYDLVPIVLGPSGSFNPIITGDATPGNEPTGAFIVITSAPPNCDANNNSLFVGS